MEILVLGSGTSHGVPMIGCRCDVCLSDDPRNRRFRPSILVRHAGRAILVDTTPELRMQALAFDVRQVDAVLYTHTHADHLMGLDDLRRFNDLSGREMPVYGDDETLEGIRRTFPYIFKETQAGGGKPRLTLHPVEPDFTLFGLRIRAFTVLHGRLPVTAYRFDAPAGDATSPPATLEAQRHTSPSPPAPGPESLRGAPGTRLEAQRHRGETAEHALQLPPASPLTQGRASLSPPTPGPESFRGAPGTRLEAQRHGEETAEMAARREARRHVGAMAGADVQGAAAPDRREAERGVAYVTDVSSIPPASLELMRGLDVLILDAVRFDPHPTHFGLYQALDVIAEVQPRQAYLTHLSHHFDHEKVNAQLPANVRLAYDGLVT
jgi:phosphoribosyl 1,2-cyclic phosphodiesterase